MAHAIGLKVMNCIAVLLPKIVINVHAFPLPTNHYLFGQFITYDLIHKPLISLEKLSYFVVQCIAFDAIHSLQSYCRAGNILWCSLSPCSNVIIASSIAVGNTLHCNVLLHGNKLHGKVLPHGNGLHCNPLPRGNPLHKHSIALRQYIGLHSTAPRQWNLLQCNALRQYIAQQSIASGQ